MDLRKLRLATVIQLTPRGAFFHHMALVSTGTPVPQREEAIR